MGRMGGIGWMHWMDTAQPIVLQVGFRLSSTCATTRYRVGYAALDGGEELSPRFAYTQPKSSGVNDENLAD